jgi:hypothetical protein
VAGVEGGATNDVALYWKNGVPVILTDGTKRGFANSIFVSGSDVYVAGAESSPATGSIAEYWKNGVPVVLADSTQGAMAWSIFVSGADVYVAGYEYETLQTGPDSYSSEPVAEYWKNGVPVQLTDGTQAATAFSIFISGSDVYVAGFNCTAFVPDCSEAAYWKNGTLTTLSTAMDSTANSVVVSGSDVYVSGDTGSVSVGNPLIAEYWENGAPTQLAESTAGVTANQIAVSGTDVYVVGASGGVAEYWKNGTPVTLTDGTYFATAFAVAVATQ